MVKNLLLSLRTHQERLNKWTATMKKVKERKGKKGASSLVRLSIKERMQFI